MTSRSRNIIYLVVLAVILVLGEGIGALIILQGAPVIGQSLRWVCRLAAALWIVYGLYLFREIKWVKRISTLIILTVVAALIAGLCHALGSISGLIAITGI